MSEAPQYFAWYPSVEDPDDVISVLLTSAGIHRGPVGGQMFFESVLAGSGWEADIVAWGTEHFLTDFFGPPGEWRECWNARLIISGKARKRSGGVVLHFAVTTEPERTSEPKQRIPVWVLADLPGPAAAESCVAELDRRFAAGDLRCDNIYRRAVSHQLEQVVVDMATLAAEEVASIEPTIADLRVVFQAYGGSIRPVDVSG